MHKHIRNKCGKIRFNFVIIGLLALSLIGSTAILTIVALKSQNDSLTRSTLQSNFEGARNLNVTMNERIRLMHRSLGATAKFIMERDGSVGQNSDYLKAMMAGQSFNLVVIVDEAGVIHSSVPDSDGLMGQLLADPAAIRALEVKKPFISEPYVASTGRSVILISQPMFDGQGQYRGFVGGFIYLQEVNVFTDIFSHAIRSENGTYAYVVDRSGDLLYNPDNKRIGEVLDAGEIKRKLQNGTGRGHSVISPEGRVYLAGYLAMPKIGWGIVYQSPETVLHNAMKELVKSQLVLIIPMFGLLLIISLWIARRLTAPFAVLTATARRIASGERINDPPFTSHWNYEAHHLARAMMRAVGGLQHHADKMTEQARTDKLTGLANRASLEDRVAEWITEGKSFSLLVLDIDHFKAVNDTYGHRTGDETLLHLARILETETRKEDMCCRFGGEEFIVLLPMQSLKVGWDIAERIRSRTEDSVSPTGNPITVSIGLASYPDHGEDFNKVFERADQALYNAKRNGRNLTVNADDPSFIS